MRYVRGVTRAIGWLFVVAIAIHGYHAADNAAHAAGDHHWGRFVVQGAIAVVVAVLVIGVVVFAIRSRAGASRARRREHR